MTPAPGEPAPDWLDALLTRALEIPEPAHDPLDFHSPAERLRGRLAGLPADAPLPLAAWAVGESGVWAFVSPVHLQIETNQVVALPQSMLDLDLVTSTRLFETLAELFPDAEGWQRRFLNPHTWAVSHEQLDGLRLASLSRAVGRPLTPWLPDDKRIRRWTNELQMLWHGRGVKANSVWWWGAGRAAAPGPDLHEVQGLLPEDATLLSLAGDERLRSFRLDARRWWQRRGPGAAEVWASL